VEAARRWCNIGSSLRALKIDGFTFPGEAVVHQHASSEPSIE
jgi:hypothetical protein